MTLRPDCVVAAAAVVGFHVTGMRNAEQSGEWRAIRWAPLLCVPHE
jgi:hypothetical protein